MSLIANEINISGKTVCPGWSLPVWLCGATGMQVTAGPAQEASSTKPMAEPGPAVERGMQNSNTAVPGGVSQEKKKA